MIKVQYSYWTGDDTEVIEFKTNTTPKTMKKILRGYDRDYDSGDYDGALEDYILELGYKFIPYIDNFDVCHEA